jgi:nucleotidyltransferase substrate binding protein (TIGR01987 family)
MNPHDQFVRALARLDAALAQPPTELTRDAAIQRFEFCFELCWKTLQHQARHCGTDLNSPRAAFAFARRQGWIEDESAWVEMLKARNLTVHTYNEDQAAAVFTRLPLFSHLFKDLLEALAK